jgi:hypothetical protein
MIHIGIRIIAASIVSDRGDRVRSALRIGAIIASLFIVSCSHYVSTPEAPANTDNAIDNGRTAFLEIKAVFEPDENQWAVTMMGRRGSGGPEITIANAEFVVNGVRRSLDNGFPYRGTPETLYLPNTGPLLSLEYRSPEQQWMRTEFVLEYPPRYSMTFRASRTSGLEANFTPALRMNESITVKIYKSLPESVRHVATRSFSTVDATSFVIDPAVFASEIGTDKELIVEFERAYTNWRRAIFNEGIELKQILNARAQYVAVVP